MALPKTVVSARRDFRSEYGSTTANIIKRIAKGQESGRIAEVLELGVGTVGTTKGNLTRGLYAPFAFVQNGQVKGTCSFAS